MLKIKAQQGAPITRAWQRALKQKHDKNCWKQKTQWKTSKTRAWQGKHRTRPQCFPTTKKQKTQMHKAKNITCWGQNKLPCYKNDRP